MFPQKKDRRTFGILNDIAEIINILSRQLAA